MMNFSQKNHKPGKKQFKVLNTIRTSVFLSMVFLLFGMTADAQKKGAKIGYIDMEYILDNLPEYQQANTQLNAKVQRWNKDLEKMMNEIEQMKLNLDNEKVLLTKELIEQREEEIKTLEDEMNKYQQDRFGPNGDLVIQRRQLVQPIRDQINNIVQEIYESEDYDFIFDKSAGNAVLFVNKRNDLSDKVLARMNGLKVSSRNERGEIERQKDLPGEREPHLIIGQQF